MKINRNNYEVWFIDFYDGCLNGKDIQILYDFLESNADLQIEFDEYSDLKLPKLDLPFEGKEILKKYHYYITTAEEKLIAAVEGDLKEHENNAFKKECDHNLHLKKQKQLFELTKLQPVNNVFYPDRGILKKPILVIFKQDSTKLQWIARIAAVLFVMLLGTSAIYFYTNKQTTNIHADVGTLAHPDTDNSREIVDKNQLSTHPADEITQETVLNKTIAVDKNTVTSVVAKHNIKISNNLSESISGKNPIKIELLEPVSKDQVEMNSEVALIIPEPSIKWSPVEGQKYMGLIDGLVTIVQKEVMKEKEQNDYTIPNASQNEDSYNKVKLMDVIGLGVGKVSRDKIKLNSQYNEKGKLTAVNLSLRAKNKE
jgi:hypothetical protein